MNHLSKINAIALRQFLSPYITWPISWSFCLLFFTIIPHGHTYLSMLASISSSSDQLVKEASLLLEDAKYANRQAHVCPLLRAARVSISSLQLSVSSRALKAATTKMINDYHTKIWDAQLERLKVQSKFQDIIALESDCPSWNRIISGLPSIIFA